MYVVSLRGAKHITPLSTIPALFIIIIEWEVSSQSHVVLSQMLVIHLALLTTIVEWEVSFVSHISVTSVNHVHSVTKDFIAGK